MSEIETELPGWAELDQQFGRAGVGTVDHAVTKFFNEYPTEMRREDYYLITEGLTHAVLMAMRQRGLRFQNVVQAIR